MAKRPDPRLERLLDEGAAAYQARDWSAARRAYRQAAAKAPDDIRAVYSLAMVDLREGRLAEAARGFRRVSAHDPSHHGALRNLAALAEQTGQWTEARAAYARSLELAPEDAEAGFGLARALAVLGETDAAETAYRRLASAPSSRALALARLAALDARRITDQDLSAIQAAQRTPLSGDLAVELAFAEAASLRMRGLADESFAAFTRANGLRRKALAASGVSAEAALERFARSIEGIEAQFSAERIAHAAARTPGSRGPIFIVGLPRSGSSLLERLLAAHAEVAAIGESGLLGEIVDPWLDRDDADWARLAATFRDRARALAGGRRGPIVDKTLENALRIGPIALMFPEAVILHCVRDPVATGLSCWRQLFAAGNESLYDLEDIARTMALHARLMAHWSDAVPGRVVEVWLETLTADPETEIRRLLETQCGLGWRPADARISPQSYAAATASAGRVFGPITSDAQSDNRLWASHIGAFSRAVRHAASDPL
jgi:tetratricopeptide (TPR) repeat protein